MNMVIWSSEDREIEESGDFEFGGSGDFNFEGSRNQRIFNSVVQEFLLESGDLEFGKHRKVSILRHQQI